MSGTDRAGATRAADTEAAAAALSTAPREETGGDDGSGGPNLPRLGVIGWTRWFWRQLTSMRVALILLFLLSLAAIPGSIIPQQNTEPVKVTDFLTKHTLVGPLYTRLGLFHVYSSVWFSAIYILLFVSLAGCIVPRAWQFVGQLNGRPPRAPRKLDRMPAYATWTTEAEPDVVLKAATARLRSRRYRIAPDDGSVAAEKGYLREAGNLLFHIALFGLLIAFAIGTLFKSDGTTLVTTGGGFSNNQTQYDDLSHGALFDPDDMAPFGFTLNTFKATYQTSGPTKGTPVTFSAGLTYAAADGKEHRTTIHVNEPLKIEGNKVYLTSHGYSMNVTVHDAKGNVAFTGPVPFLPLDGNLASQGVIKVPDAVGKDGKPEQLGFAGLFTPTTVKDPVMGPQSTFPALGRPDMFLTAYYGDLGMDAGLPQNVYQLDTANKNLHQFKFPNGSPLSVQMAPGDSLKLPNGAGTLTFNGVDSWADFEIVHQPGIPLALGSALSMLLGLAGSLFIQRRRVWVRAVAGPGGRTVVEMAGLGRSESPKVADELTQLVRIVHEQAPTAPDPQTDPTDDAREAKEHA
ncbi:cytochrome c biogenesis protein ResB [Streptomyces sp. SL13]|uniref:Cytochrome c biogenesis protein ResB n=1 Tax=Streptantibioticus silvisoli TaxID=2705255 RepID=A0AA90H7A0_9ACTN|nr:cytochrome c biogenesis protein ResB [Streptantibioticus silvisoli]MDI5966697.1 cytochrome c biogenesis protein ResB [Streptantibioticus silvisoli]MDI5972265.1 cytochrome c biogenesis protein ResB [Streptantibioticus silvisoli]